MIEILPNWHPLFVHFTVVILIRFFGELVKPQLASVSVPTLIFSGRNDWVMDPSEAEALHAGLPQSKLVILEECGHFSWIDQKELFFENLDNFLTSEPKTSVRASAIE